MNNRLVAVPLSVASNNVLCILADICGIVGDFRQVHATLCFVVLLFYYI
tara:strand:- start:63 stop:209 length:147 start_codon:yes stop_codon:yes gene_type:complete